MSSSGEDIVITTAVAIDKDKNSQYAVRWAVENKKNNNVIVLVHIKTQAMQPEDSIIPKDGRPPNEVELQQIFLSFRGFCARKGVRVKEVVLHDIDVSSALVDFISRNSINIIVLGISNRSALTRAFRNPDVPTTLGKSAPEFCSVYAVSKGKLLKIRTASEPATPSGTTNLAQPPPISFSMASSVSDDFNQNFSQTSWKSGGSEMISFERSRDKISFERSGQRIPPDKRFSKISSPRKNPNIRVRTKGSVCLDSTSDDGDFHAPSSFQSADISYEQLNYSGGASDNKTSQTSISSQNSQDAEDEINRLRLELKHTMAIYNSAFKETVTAEQKAKAIDEQKSEEAYQLEEAKLGEEVALAMVDIERQRSKAAMEAAEMAQRLAELEGKKRKHAENKAKHESQERQKVMQQLARNDVRYRKYSIQDIEVATNMFDKSSKIGEGGYGPVYKGFLDHTPVAIKVLKSDITQGKKQFQQEIEVLSCMRHPNMVLLVGACPEYGCLVYEYMENGSLEDRLFRKNNSPTISWQTRFKICAEIATALLFLHQAKPEPLVHRDLKPGNILLDRNYVSKISDVGLARLIPSTMADSVTQYHMTAAAGTFCYIDPEYQQTGMLGTKSDVYSLGIMLLQVITARHAMGLTHQVYRAIERGTFEEILDPTVTDWPIEDTLSFAKISLQCCELRKKDRPDLATVILPELNRLRALGEEDNQNWDFSVIPISKSAYVTSSSDDQEPKFC